MANGDIGWDFRNEKQQQEEKEQFQPKQKQLLTVRKGSFTIMDTSLVYEGRSISINDNSASTATGHSKSYNRHHDLPKGTTKSTTSSATATTTDEATILPTKVLHSSS